MSKVKSLLIEPMYVSPDSPVAIPGKVGKIIGVKLVEYEKYDIAKMNELIGGRTFTSAGYLPNGDAALVDDEGLFTITPESMITKVSWYPEPLVGNILVSGVNHNNGESMDVKSTIEEINELIEWSMPIFEAKLRGLI